MFGSSSGSSFAEENLPPRKRGMKRKMTERGVAREIIPTVRLPVQETHAATRQDLKRAMKRVTGKQELKWVDAYASNLAAVTAVATNGTYVNGIAQGNTTTTRQGNQVTITSIQARFTVHTPTSSTAQPGQWCRLLVVCDNEGSGLTLSQAIDATTITDATMSPYNLNYVGKQNRIKILFDRRFFVDVDAAPASNIQIYNIKLHQFKKQLKRIEQFIGTTSNAADIGRNGICFWFIANNTTPLLDYGFRTIFKDD